MALTKGKMLQYTQILKSELRTAMGCTEPIAIAYCAACARKVLAAKPERYEVFCSANIVKNVKAVVVPQTGGLKGIETAALAGGIGGNADAELEVLSCLTDAHRQEICDCLKKGIVEVKPLEGPHALHILVKVYAGTESACVEIIDSHTQIGRIWKNDELLREHVIEDAVEETTYESQELNVRDILSYAQKVDLASISDVLERQISYNSAISEEGLAHVYGAGIGPVLMENAIDSVRERAKAAAAAGSDARMNGCPLPVVINSGSGNQGITVSLPIIVYAREMDKPHEDVLRALCFGNLVAIHQKKGIGKLSAFCGATCAAAGAVAGIAYLEEEDYDTIAQAIVNAVATVGGMVCDGAKSSCAGKIAVALESAFIGYEAAKEQRGYRNGEGIVKQDVEKTIESVGRMASKGMHETDKEIIEIMLEK